MIDKREITDETESKCSCTRSDVFLFIHILYYIRTFFVFLFIILYSSETDDRSASFETFPVAFFFSSFLCIVVYRPTRTTRSHPVDTFHRRLSVSVIGPTL